MDIIGNFMLKILKDFSLKAVYDVLKYYSVPILSVLATAVYPIISKYTGPKFLDEIPSWGRGVIFGIVLVFIYAGYGIGAAVFRRIRLFFVSGLFYYDPNLTEDDKTQNKELLVEEARKANTIELIGATGYKTFAKNDSEGTATLRDAFQNAKGEIKVILLNPEGEQARNRATAVNMNWEDYKHEIESSIRFLKELKNKGKAVSLKFYDQKPIWKLIRLDNFMWLQYYHPNSHVEKMPVYGLKRAHGKGNHNLFDPLYSVFEKKWLHDSNPYYDFSTDKIVYLNETAKMKNKRK